MDLELLKSVDSFIWGPPLLALLVGTGILLTCRLRLIQVFRLKKALSLIFSAQNNGEGDINSFKALCTALAATIGTGNIVLDVDGRFLRHGHEVRRRSSGGEIP